MTDHDDDAVTRDEWLESVAEDRAQQARDGDPGEDSFDRDWHYPRDLAPRSPW